MNSAPKLKNREMEEESGSYFKQRLHMSFEKVIEAIVQVLASEVGTSSRCALGSRRGGS